MDIRCRKTTCKYNDHFTCKAKDIKISKKIVCTAFEKTSSTPDDVTKDIFSKPPKYAPMRNSKTLNIYCDARCLFNNNGICSANGITVNDIKNCPLCVTFLEK